MTVRDYTRRDRWEAVLLNMERRGPVRSVGRWCMAHARLIGLLYGRKGKPSLRHWRLA